MRLKRKNPLFRPALLGLCFVLNASAVAQGTWTRHQNHRYGFSFEYPAGTFKFERAAKGGDGEMFVAPSFNARLVVGAVNNTEGHTTASYQAFAERKTYRNDRITYRKRGQGWFVLSGFKGEKIFYEKVIFSCDGRLINGFALSYPARHNRFISPMIERIEDTFRPGPSGCS
jgi:hypothetical protein